MKTFTLFSMREHLEELEKYLKQVESGEAFTTRPGLLGVLHNLLEDLGRYWTLGDECDDIRERLKALGRELAADTWRLEAAQSALGAALMLGQTVSQLEEQGLDGDTYPRVLQKVKPASDEDHLASERMRSALVAIREAGGNEDATAQWMQKVAAAALEPDLFPVPADRV